MQKFLRISMALATVILFSHSAMAMPSAGSRQLSWPLRFDGIGPLIVGMTFDEVNRHLGKPLARIPVKLRGTPNCEQLEVDDIPGVWLMFIDDVLKRIDVGDKSTTRTQAGAGIGDPIAKVIATYPDATRTPGAYAEDQTRLTIRQANSSKALRFETDADKVIVFYAGEWEQLNYDEGCL